MLREPLTLVTSLEHTIVTLMEAQAYLNIAHLLPSLQLVPAAPAQPSQQSQIHASAAFYW